MSRLRFKEHAAPKVKDPIFVEGLPGVGNVGKLACEHLADTLDAKLWYDIFSPDFPPQVTIQEDGTVRLVRAQLWTAPRAAGKRDLVLMTGDYQPLSSEGQYELVEAVLERLGALGCKEMFTLGGFGLGARIDEPGVLGAATHKDLVDRLRKAGARVDPEEPGGGIIGASGLFLGLGMERGIRGACLMGETSGYIVDPKAARAVLTLLADLIGLKDLAMDDLEDKATEIDRIAQQLHEAEAAARSPSESDLHYIG